MRKTSLFVHLKIQVSKDALDERKILFDQYLKISPWRRSFYKWGMKYRTLASVVATFYGFVSSSAWSFETSRLKKRAGWVIEVWPNEMANFDRFQSVFDKHNIQRPMKNRKSASWFRNFLVLSAHFSSLVPTVLILWRVRAILSRMLGEFDGYVVLRASSYLFSYAKLKNLAEGFDPKSIWISSDGNPMALAAAAIAREQGRQLMYIAHSPRVSHPAPLRAQVGVFWGVRGLQDFKKAGAHFDREFILPHLEMAEARDAKIESEKHLLISLSKGVDPVELKAFVHLLGDIEMVSKITVCAHPNSFESLKNVRQLFSDHVDFRVGFDAALAKNKFAVNISGYSAVHIDCLSRGIPTLYYGAIDGTAHLNHDWLKDLQIPICHNTDDVVRAITALLQSQNQANDKLSSVSQPAREFMGQPMSDETLTNRWLEAIGGIL